MVDVTMQCTKMVLHTFTNTKKNLLYCFDDLTIKKTRMPFSQRPTSRLPIEVRTYNLTLIWPWLYLWPWPCTSQIKLIWFQVAKLAFSMRWPWPWPNDLDTQKWPRYVQDITPYQNEVSMSTHSKVTAQTDRHTDRQTDTQRNENITSTPTYTGGKSQRILTK